MVSLSDFNEAPAPRSMKEFYGGEEEKGPVANRATIENMAAYGAALSAPDQMEQTFSRVRNELMTGSSSSVLNQRMIDFDQADRMANEAVVRDILANPDYNIEQKEQAVRSLAFDPNARSLSERIGRAALLAESEPDDNEEQERTRMYVSDVLDEVDIYQGYVQKEINRVNNLFGNETFGDRALQMASDFAKIVLPFYEQTFLAGAAANLSDELEGEVSGVAVLQALTLMGESRQSFREVLQQMPPEQRVQAAERLIQYVEASNGPEGFDNNQLLALHNLRSMLASGGYASHERFLDNLASMVDNTILGGMIARPIIRGAGAAASLARAYSPAGRAGVARRYEEALENINNPDTRVRVSQDIAEDYTTASGGGANPLAAEDLISSRLIDELPDEVARTQSAEIRGEVHRALQGADRTTDPQRLADELLSTTAGRVSREARFADGFDAVEDLRRAARDHAIRTDNSPKSVVSMYQQTNPNKARNAFKMAVDDTTGVAARALSGGGTRAGLISDMALPEIARASEAVKPKARLLDESLPRPDLATLDRIRQNRNTLTYTAAEKAAMRTAARDQFENVAGVVPRREMATIGNRGARDNEYGMSFDMVYGPRDGGFVRASEGREQVKRGLAKYGVKDDDIQVLVRDVEGYRPATASDNLLADGDYLIRVKYDYEFAPGDMRVFDTAKGTGWRYLDFKAAGQSIGGWLQNAVPPTAIISNVISNPAIRASDVSAFVSRRIQELGAQYANARRGLSKEQLNLLDRWIVEANEKGLRFNTESLRARGMEAATINAARQWKTTWDTIYHLENIDLNKTLRARGWEKFVDGANDTDLIVRPLPRGEVRGGVRVYDPQNGGSITTMSRAQIDELYEGGGRIAATRTPIEDADDVYNHILVRNNEGGSYTRALRDDDYTLAYRHGYYHIEYDSPYFLIERIVDKDGREFTKAIATAANRSDAERELQRLRTADGRSVPSGQPKYDFRFAREMDSAEREAMEWSQIVSQGRSSQRIRGERLYDVSHQGPSTEMRHIESPEESLLNSIMSVAQRTSFRDVMETMKARWANQHGNLLENPKKWPETPRLIGQGSASARAGQIGDAISSWRYIDALENGYTDILHNFTKSMFNSVSDVAGRTGWKWLEDMSRKASQFNTNRFARKKAFRLLLSANPIRQAILQPSMALPVIMATNARVMPYLPGRLSLLYYMKAGGDVNSFYRGRVESALTGMSRDEAMQMMNAYRASGIEDFVSAHTFMREQLSTLVDRTMFAKVSTAAGRPLDFTQKIGFEFGENLLMSSVWMSEYDRMRRAGMNMASREVLDQISVRTRSLTGDMNRAGEMPYNQNAMSGLMQFFSTPHKVFAGVYMGHNNLTWAERAKLGFSYLATFGMGRGYVSDFLLRQLPREMDKESRDYLERGITDAFINKTLSYIYGEEVDIAVSEGLRIGVAQPNLMRWFNDLIALNIPELVASSPSGGFIMGNNPRLTELVVAMTRPFTAPKERKLEEAERAGKAFLNLFTGASNFMKARYILANQRTITASGQETGTDVGPWAAMARLAGFSTWEEVNYWAAREEIYKNSGQDVEDVEHFVREMSRVLARDGISRADSEYYLTLMQEAQLAWDNDPHMMKLLSSEMQKISREQGNNFIFNAIMRQMNYVSESQMEDYIRTVPDLSDEEREAFMQRYRQIRSSR